MKNADKTKEQLLNEIALLQQRLQELEFSQSQCQQREQVISEQLAQEQANRCLAEQSFKALQQQMANVFEALPDAVICVDTEWRYTSLNHNAEALLGKPRSELLGKSPWEVFPSLIETQGYTLCYKAMAEQQPIEYEEFYPEFDKWFAIRLYPSATGLCSYFRDITPHKQAQLALQSFHQRIIAVLESITDGFAAFDREWRYTYVNQRAAEMVHKKPEELIGKVVWEVFPEAVGTIFYQAYHRAVAEQVSVDVEEFYPTFNTWFRVRAYPSPEGLSVYYQDVTQQKQADAEREQLLSQEQVARQQAEAANRIKDEFLAVLSHELRSPLNPIVGWTRMLLAGKLDATRRQTALETIERNARALSQLIEDLLDVSRILRGKLTLETASVNLATIVSAAIETVRLAAEAKSIDLQMQFEPSIGLLIGDANRLQQVAWNLLSNAVKFTPAGGRVEVRLSYTETYAQIQVSDTGKGIDAEFLPHVFDYFRQADSSTTRTFGGLGLGLAIARHIIEAHGGTIAAESAGEGRGATFTVKLPLQKGASRHNFETSQTTSIQPSLTGVRALVVDDESDTRDLVAYVLEQSGAIVTAVSSATDALAALSQSQPDLLICDIGMPEMDGYMLIRQIRQLFPEQGGKVPAIALTAYASSIDRQRVLEAGFQKHITKPIDPTEFINVVATAIEAL